MQIPYIFAGESEIDVELALFKLKNIMGINKLLLEGGSIVNGYFERADIIDELSLVVTPLIAGSEDKPLFMDSNVSDYKLNQIKQYDNGVVWMNYKRLENNRD
jgi:riboflavin biosynthesis pyrimidine reductase